MRIYILRLDSRSLLTRAFDTVLAAPDVESCMIEAQERRLRFLAPVKAAEELVERIYLDGGLRWCTRHKFRAHGDTADLVV